MLPVKRALSRAILAERVWGPAALVCETVAVGLLLVGCGSFAAVVGLVRGYAAARSAVGPFVHAGEPGRRRVDAGAPARGRTGVRGAVRSVVLAVGWLTVALYGLFLASAGAVLG